MTPSSFLRTYVAHDLGGDLHRLAQRAAVVAAAVYVAGMAAGVVIHWANDWLSGNRRPWPVRWATFITLTVQLETDAVYDRVRSVLESLSVKLLRQYARELTLRQAGGRSIHLANKADLVDALLPAIIKSP
jgi:hypothetical protein